MGMSVTTYGKWETQRVALVKKLVSNTHIQQSKENIDNALFTTVNEQMVKAGYAYVRANNGSLPLKELTLNCYEASLGVVLDALSSALAVEKDFIQDAVEQFHQQAMDLANQNIDDLLLIGNVSITSKQAAISKLYGNDFATNYPELAKQLPTQDKELFEISRNACEQFIREHNFGDFNTIIEEHLIYMNQVAPQLNPTEAYQTLFKEKTGNTMEDYKADIANAKVTIPANLHMWSEKPVEGDETVDNSLSQSYWPRDHLAAKTKSDFVKSVPW